MIYSDSHILSIFQLVLPNLWVIQHCGIKQRKSVLNNVNNLSLSFTHTHTQQLEDSLNAFGQAWKLNPGDGAFYGPKVCKCGCGNIKIVSNSD